MKRYILILMFAAGLLSSAFGCDYCLLTQGISPLETARGIGLRLDQRYTRLSTLIDHGTRVDSSDALETHWTTQLTGFYSVNSRITLNAVVPVVRRFGSEPEDAHQEEVARQRTSPVDPAYLALGTLHGDGEAGGSVFGLGDIAILGRYQFFNKHTLASTLVAAIQAGVRIPTGATGEVNDSGELFDAHLQPGTGAFNYLFGFSGSYAVRKLTVIANGIVSIPGVGEVGPDTYQFGNSLNYDLSVRYRIRGGLQASSSIFASLGVAGELRGREQLNNLDVEGTGGHTVYITPSLQVFMRPVIFEAGFWQAVAYDLNDQQLGETFKTFAGLTFMLR